MAEFNADILLQVQSGGAERQVRKIEQGINRIEAASRDILAVDKQIVSEKRRLQTLEGTAAKTTRQRLADLRLQRQEIALQKREMQGLVAAERRRQREERNNAQGGIALVPGGGGGASVASLGAAAAALQGLNQSRQQGVRVTNELTAAYATERTQADRLATKLGELEQKQRELTNAERGFGGPAALRNARNSVELRTTALERYRRELEETRLELARLTGAQRRAALEFDSRTGGLSFDERLAALRSRQASQRNARRSAAAGAAVAGFNVPGLNELIGGGAAGFAVGGPTGAAIGAATAGVVALGVASGRAANRAAILNAEVNRYRIALAGVAGDQRSYNTLLQGAAEVSQRYATPLSDTIKNLTQLQAATASAGFSAKETVDIYEDLSQANIALGGDAQSLSGILRATTQVFSKGKVQAEELRGQIGDRLPGAFADFAAASGKSTAQLDKDLEDGKVNLADFLKFAEYVGDKYGDSADKLAKSGENAGARLTKALENLQLAAGPLLTDVGANFQDLGTQIIESITPAIEVIGKLVTKLRELELAGINNRIQTLQQALAQNPNSQRNQQSLANLIERRDQISGALQPPVARTQPKQQQQQTLENVLSPEEQDRLIKRAAANLEAAKELTTELERRVLLSEMTNDLDRDALQLGFDLEDRMAEIARLEDQRFRGQQAILAQRIYDKQLADLLTKAEKDQNDELNKQVEAWKEIGRARRGAYEGYGDQEVANLAELVGLSDEATQRINGVSNAFGNLVSSVVTGTKTAGEAFRQFLTTVADQLVSTAAVMIAQYIAIGIARAFAGMGSTSLKGSEASYSGNELGGAFTNPQFGVAGRALGGPVTGNTPYVVGERGPELFVPGTAGSVISNENVFAVTRKAMAGANSGSESAADVAFEENSAALGSSAAVTERRAAAMQMAKSPVAVDVTYSAVRIDNLDYVDSAQFNAGLIEAARQGAKQGRAQVISDLRNKPATRSSLGL